MKNILCFGDSNTWGFNGENCSRFPYNKRWTTVLQNMLGDGFNIIPEGLNGRTTVFEDPFDPCKNGFKALPYCLLSHMPLNLVVLMLGTNDSKNYFHNTSMSIGKGLGRLIETIQASDSGFSGLSPSILVISPAVVKNVYPETQPFDLREFQNIDGHDPVAVSEGLSAEFEQKAKEYDCDFLDAALYAQVGDADGVHLTIEGHKALGEAISVKIKKMNL
ncbi:MAG: SGNH/GDSL hydrolase family protein [Spirochaetales bacterium]|nr:SGNH/GDSL hydrolase family protein [Spirochaetales bacterium]